MKNMYLQSRALAGVALVPVATILLATPLWSKPIHVPNPVPTPVSGAALPPGSVNITLIDMLFKNGVITQAQHDQLVAQEQQREAQDTQQAAAQTPPTAPLSTQGTSQVAAVSTTPSSEQSPTQAKPSSDKGILASLKSIGTGDGVTFKIGGRIQADYGFGMGDKTKIGTGQEMRRSRLDFSGNLGPDWDYMLSYDFGTTALKNAYLEYIGLKDTTISFGYFKEYFSLEYQTSNKATEFQERSMLDDTFDPPKRLGIGYFRSSKINPHSEYTLGVGVFGDAVPQDTDSGRDSGVGVAARGTYVPYRTDNKLVHLGLSFEYRHPGKTEEVDLSAHPNAHFAPQLIDTGDILNVDRQTKFSGEFAADIGRLSLQAQYDHMRFDRTSGGDLNFHGGYAQASLFLTDDSRARAYDGGSYGTIKPRDKKWGAWQIAVRYDTQNLNTGDIIGGKETNIDGALNWYVNKYVRFSVNYIKVTDLDRPGDIHNHDKPSIVASRMWIGF